MIMKTPKKGGGNQFLEGVETVGGIADMFTQRTSLGLGVNMLGTYNANERETAALQSLAANTKLRVSDPAFKRYVEKLNERYTSRLADFAAATAGGMAAVAAVGAFFPLGFIAGGVVGIGGGMLGGHVKNLIAPDEESPYFQLASTLQQSGLDGNFSEEQAFVARLMNMKQVDKIEKLVKRAGFDRIEDMVEALKHPNKVGYAKLTAALNDEEIDRELHNDLGIVKLPGSRPLSTRLAEQVRAGNIAGVDALSNENTLSMITMLDMADTIQRHQAQAQEMSDMPLPPPPPRTKIR